MITLTYAAHFTALLLAGALAIRDKDPRQRSAARIIAIMFALALVRRSCLPDDITERLAAWSRGEAPPAYVGAQRIVWAVGQVASRGWYIVAAWGVWSLLQREPSGVASRRRQRLALATICLAMGVVYFAAYPLIRGQTATWIAVGFYVAALVAQLIAGTAASLRGHWPSRDERASWLTAWILICSSLAGLAGPWALAHPRRDWYLVPWIAVPTWLAIGGVHLWILLLSRRTASPSK